MDEDRSGALGCGCALPIGLVLGLVAFALIGTLAGSPASASDPAAGGVTLALSERYLGSAMESVGGASEASGWRLDVLPDNQLALLGMVTATAFGREMSLPVRLLLTIAAVDGSIKFSLASAELPGGVDAATVTGLVSPLLTAASAELEAGIASALGPDWRVVGLSSSDDEVLVYLEEETAS